MTKILIDEGLTSFGRMSGIGFHIVSLASHLKDIAHCDITRHEILRRIPRYIRKWAYIGASNITHLYKDYDLVHHPANYVPLFRGKNKHVITIYDLSDLRYQETISLAWRHYNRLAFKNAVRRADAIIAISRSVADELIETFPDLDKNRIYVCPTGLRSTLLMCKPEKESLGALNVKPFSYFLFVGDLTKRKNLGFLLNAFVEAKARRLIQETTQLILVGKRAWGYSEFSSLIREEAGIHELGYLSDEQVVTLYRYAKACVYPSIYEGFGMPLIEAMSQQAPIIASSIPTTLELNAAHNDQMLCFELGDREGLIQLFKTVDEDFQSLRDRLDYGDLSMYDYPNIATKHLDIYSEVLNRQRSD